MESSALIFLDYQESLCREEGAIGGPSGLASEVSRRQVLEKAAVCLAAARKSEILVVHVKVGFAANYANRTNRSARFASFEDNQLMQIGQPGTEICSEVSPAAHEPVVEKGCVDPFVGTSLLPILMARGKTRLYLGGVATNYVVESAARHAGDSGFSVTVLEDICASYDEKMHAFAVERTLPLFASIETSDAFVTRIDG